MSYFSSSSSSTLKIGIVGFGTFGQFLAKTMIKQGHTLLATSRTDYSQQCFQMGIQFFRDVSAFLEAENDVVLICTSIVSLSGVLNSMPLTSLKRPTLFVDVLSVKEHPREFLLRVLPEESDILWTHPMFGPESGKNGWKDLTFVYDKVRIRDEVTCSNFLNIFASEGCRMLQMSCEEHDKLAAKSQFITHTIGGYADFSTHLIKHGLAQRLVYMLSLDGRYNFVLLCFTRTLAEIDAKSTPIDTKGFQALVQLKETTMRDSFDLYSGLFMHNRFAREELENLEHALHKVKEMLVQRMSEELGLEMTES